MRSGQDITAGQTGTFVRDDFTKSTIETIAKRAGYLCSNPECRILTVGAASGHEGFVNVGVAAHITAASPGGPRYGPSLTPEQRRHQSNGIWVCQTHGKFIDSDDKHFTVEMLRKWKRDAEERSFRAILASHAICDRRPLPVFSDTEDRELIERLGLGAQDDLESVVLRLTDAAQRDFAAFKNMRGWPRHTIALNLRMADKDNVRVFNVSALAETIETFNEIVVIAPPGTGKTTTLLQLVEAILSRGTSVAAFIPLSEWSSQADSFLQSIVRRHAFVGACEEHLKLLAHRGRLVLVMDGWNELDAVSRTRVHHGIRALQRDFPGLGVVVSARRQAMDVPISGPMVKIDALTYDQQLEIARALRGSQGAAILDHAWRTSGVRDLVTIPLYLTALLAHTSGDAFPTTKEEVLRLFVAEHERSTEKAEVLHTELFGFHTQMLTALAAEATRTVKTVISDNQARSVIKRVEDELSDQGQMQISTAPQPKTVLDVLVSHHLLIRSEAETAELSFQHQQFQEWYASFEVEALMRDAAASNQKASQKLRADVLNMPAWEESILFACERVSRLDRAGLQAVAVAILETIAIDPMLAAEMIYRSSAGVWDEIKDKVIAFVERWHVSGKVDRAVHFMISTGRSEFAPQIWPLISNPDSQVHLKALRAGRRFRPSVLGADVQVRIEQLPEEVRENVVSSIASEGGMDGIELATRLAQTDISIKVQVSAIEALHFRRADRFVAEILRTAPDQVWQRLARRGYAEEIADPDVATRLRRERQHYIESEVNPLSKLRVLLDPRHHVETLGREVGVLIEDADFPVKDQHATWIIHEAYKRYPNEVTWALIHRLEAGQEIPFKTEDLLEAADVAIDEGPLVALVMQPDTPEKVVEAAVRVVGPETVGKLIDTLVAIHTKLEASGWPADEPAREKGYQLKRCLSKTGQKSFIQAVLRRSPTVEPHEIALLAVLVAGHGQRDGEEPLQLSGELYEQMIAVIGRWAEILLTSPVATRAQLAEVAWAIERLAAPELVPALHRMLKEDLARWRRERDEVAAARARGTPVQYNNNCYTLQYSRAFKAIGNDEVVEVMKMYLLDNDFGVDAACVLKDIWDRKHNPPKDKWFPFWKDFSEVKARRMARQDQGVHSESSALAEAIIAVVSDLAKPDAGEKAHRQALQLAKVAFSVPYGNKTEVINTLLQLPLPLAEKQGFLTVLVLAGEIINADMVLDGIKTMLEEVKTNRWMLNENGSELEGWLELLPFSDRPCVTVDGLELLEPNLRPPWRLRRLLSALGYAPSSEAEHILDLLPRQDERFLSEYDWLTALEKRGTVSAARILLNLICEGVFAGVKDRLDTWVLSKSLVSAILAHTNFRSEVYHRYESLAAGPGKTTLEYVISEVADEEGVLILVNGYAARGRSFDQVLESAIRQAAMGECPSENWAGANEVFSVPVSDLRKKLFGMIGEDTAKTKLAVACLTAIDELRDEYGPPESEPRHPDIDSGRPWPLAAGYP